MTSSELVVTEIHQRVCLIRLNRPEKLNALCHDLIVALGKALDEAENNPDIGAIILTGNERAFAAGADIDEMKDYTFAHVFLEDFITKGWEHVTTCRKPIIAAVAGYALGGGCELAMMCDFIIAADTAKFGQPEINIGAIPGAGGTQRLPRYVGKSKAMDMCLTGRLMPAEEAEHAGLVSRVVDADKLLDVALEAAINIADKSLPIAMMVKESVNQAYETNLAEGIKFERRLFHSCFALADQAEGMQAFAEKRNANFKHR